MSDNSYQNGFSKTWMLFESGNGVVVDLSLFSPPPQNPRPIDAYVVTEVDGTVTRSARRSAGAVYEAVSRIKKDLGPVVAGFDFAGASPVTGESGGLAFAVALAKRLMGEDPGPVAATGIVQSSHNGGPVKGIRGIESKLKAAAMVLPSGGWLLYPSENNDEISPRLRKRLIEEGIRLRPVGSVAEAVDILFETGNLPIRPLSKKNAEQSKTSDPTNRNKALHSLFLLFLFLVLSATVLIAIRKDKEDVSAPVAGDLENSKITVRIADEYSEEIESPQSDAERSNGNLRRYEGVYGEANASEHVKPDTDAESAGDGELSDFRSGNNPEAGAEPNNDFEIGEKLQIRLQDDTTPDPNDLATDKTSAAVDMFGRSRLNSRISQVLTKKLKNFFSANRRLDPMEEIKISGQVVVLRIEETWIEEKQNYRSNLKVALRDFSYKDEKRTIARTNIETDIHGDGPVEEMISKAAQDLMNQILDSSSSLQE